MCRLVWVLRVTGSQGLYLHLEDQSLHVTGFSDSDPMLTEHGVKLRLASESLELVSSLER